MPTGSTLSNNTSYEQSPTAIVAYASETGTAVDIADEVVEYLHLRGCVLSSPICLSSLTLPSLQSLTLPIILIISTCGEGSVPQTLQALWSVLRRKSLPLHCTLSNLRFALLGLGDSSYRQYNAAARKFSIRLRDLGAVPITPLALADDAIPSGIDSALQQWMTELYSVFELPNAPLEGIQARPPRIRLRVKKSSSAPFFTNNRSNSIESEGHISIDMWQRNECTALGFFDSCVSVNELLTSHGEQAHEDHSASEKEPPREVRHVELRPPREGDVLENLSQWQYSPGAVAEIMPRNRSSAVNALLQLCNLDGNDIVEFIGGDASRLRTRLPACLNRFVAAQVDLGGRVHRRLLRKLAGYAKDIREKEKLEHLASSDGAQDFEQYAQREMRTPLLVLRDFPSARPEKFEELVDLLPVMKARGYSIASRNEEHGPCIQLCAVMERFVTPLRFARIGIASAMLERLQEGDVLPMRILKGEMKFDENRSLVLVATGTGIAAVRAAAVGKAKNKLLVQGCRNEDDALYKEEWEKILEKSDNLKVVWAMSRTGPEKVYVQDCIRDIQKEIWEMIAEGAAVHVAGRAGAMPRAVRLAIVDIVREQGNLSEEQAEVFVRKMENSRRLQFECW